MINLQYQILVQEWNRPLPFSFSLHCPKALGSSFKRGKSSLETLSLQSASVFNELSQEVSIFHSLPMMANRRKGRWCVSTGQVRWAQSERNASLDSELKCGSLVQLVPCRKDSVIQLFTIRRVEIHWVLGKVSRPIFFHLSMMPTTKKKKYLIENLVTLTF